MNSSTIDHEIPIDRLPLLPAVVIVSFALVCFALSPSARAVTPAPDGGYDNRNTAEGQDALFSWPSTTLDGENTAIGYEALYKDTDGVYNTGIGSFALFDNTSGIANTRRVKSSSSVVCRRTLGT